MTELSQWDICIGPVNDRPTRWAVVSEDAPEIAATADDEDDALLAFYEAIEGRVLH